MSYHEFSNLAFLEPTQALELYSPKLKNSNRYHGSFRLNLRKNAKVAEYARNYTPGDPLHLIDWKAYGRSDQLIVRQLRDEASATVVIVVDIGDSMFWPDARIFQLLTSPPTAQKSEVALRCALHLAHVHLTMGDFVKLWLWDTPDAAFPQSHMVLKSPKDVVSLFVDLKAGQFAKTKIQSHALENSDFDLFKADVGYFFSDGLIPRAWPRVLEVAKQCVGFFHVLSSWETDLQWLPKRSFFYDNFQEQKEFRGEKLLAGDSLSRALLKLQTDIRAQVNQQQAEHYYTLISEKTSIQDFQSALTHAHS